MRSYNAHATNVVSGLGMVVLWLVLMESEDYITLVALQYVAPTAQTATLAYTFRQNSNGSFTAASPAPNNYLVVASTSATHQLH
jgi:hypothetical protein